jgi:hypothetical protein
MGLGHIKQDDKGPAPKFADEVIFWAGDGVGEDDVDRSRELTEVIPTVGSIQDGDKCSHEWDTDCQWSAGGQWWWLQDQGTGGHWNWKSLG